jgi:hypothetical protein
MKTVGLFQPSEVFYKKRNMHRLFINLFNSFIIDLSIKYEQND